MADTTDLEFIEKFARYAMDENRLFDWEFKWTRATTKYGRCDYDKKTISLSKPLAMYDVDDNEYTDTILHEIAHAIAGPNTGHGPIWREIASGMGVKIEQYANAKAPSTETSGPRWLGECDCNDKWTRNRLSSRTYRCADCHSEVIWKAA